MDNELGQLIHNTLEAESNEFDLAARVMARLPAPSSGGTPRGWRLFWVPALATAGALALFLTLSGHDNSITNDCAIDQLDVTGASATVLKLNETGTTVVWLNEASEEEEL